MHDATPRLHLAAALAVLMLAAQCAHASDTARTRTGIGPTPAFTCLTTTIIKGGTTRMSTVTRSSGNLQRDNAALKFARSVRFTNPDGSRYRGEERQVSMLVRMHQNGRFAWRSFEADEELPEICSTPAETGRD